MAGWGSGGRGGGGGAINILAGCSVAGDVSAGVSRPASPSGVEVPVATALARGGVLLRGPILSGGGADRRLWLPPPQKNDAVGQIERSERKGGSPGTDTHVLLRGALQEPVAAGHAHTRSQHASDGKLREAGAFPLPWRRLGGGAPLGLFLPPPPSPPQRSSLVSLFGQQDLSWRGWGGGGENNRAPWGRGVG